MRSEGSNPAEGKRPEWEEDQDGRAGEPLVLDVFRRRVPGFFGMRNAFVILENAATFPTTIGGQTAEPET